MAGVHYVGIPRATVLAGTLLTEIRYELDDLDAVKPKFDDTMLLVWLSDAVQDMVQWIGAVWPKYWFSTGETRSQWDNLVAGRYLYALPFDYYVPLAVVTMDATGTQSLRPSLTFERTLETAADGYFIQYPYICLYPTPTVSVSRGIRFYYIQAPARITSTTQSVPMSWDFRGLLKEYVVIKAKARDEEASGAFAELYRKFQSQLTAMMVRSNADSVPGVSVPRRSWM